MKIVEPRCEILFATPNPVDVVATAARTCYQSEAKTDKADYELVKRLISSGHHAMLEFASITARFTTDRGVSHELVRHRLCSFAQESTRYCNYSGKDMEFIKPFTMVVENSSVNDDGFTPYELWYGSVTDAEETYNAMLKAGCSPQIARSVLPNSLKTEINVSANLREWRHIIALRTSPAAHPDMRHLMGLFMYELQYYVDHIVFFEDLYTGESHE